MNKVIDQAFTYCLSIIKKFENYDDTNNFSCITTYSKKYSTKEYKGFADVIAKNISKFNINEEIQKGIILPSDVPDLVITLVNTEQQDLPLPLEIIDLIIKIIDDPLTYANIMLSCKLLYTIAKAMEPFKLEMFTKYYLITKSSQGFEFGLLPNGKFNGNLTIYSKYNFEENFTFSKGRIIGKVEGDDGYFEYDETGKLSYLYLQVSTLCESINILYDFKTKEFEFIFNSLEIIGQLNDLYKIHGKVSVTTIYTGMTICIMEYNNGVPHGKATVFNSRNGKIRTILCFENGIKKDILTRYDKKGRDKVNS